MEMECSDVSQMAGRSQSRGRFTAFEVDLEDITGTSHGAEGSKAHDSSPLSHGTVETREESVVPRHLLVEGPAMVVRTMAG